MDGYLLEAKNIEVEYSGGYIGIKDASLFLQNDKTLVVYGVNSSGKTSLLRALAGLENIKSGNILLEGKELKDILPKERNIGYSFGYESLKPDQTVYKVLSYPMSLRGFDKEHTEQRVKELVEIINLDADAKVKHLSNCEKSKLILARLFSLARKLYLIDDLTEKLQESEKNAIYELIKILSLSKSVIVATEDKEFALEYGKNNLLILSSGIAEGQGSLNDIAKMPLNMESAIVCGYELHSGILKKTGDNYVAELDEYSQSVPSPINDIYVDKKVCFCVKDKVVQPFYYDLNCERLITKYLLKNKSK